MAQEVKPDWRNSDLPAGTRNDSAKTSQPLAAPADQPVDSHASTHADKDTAIRLNELGSMNPAGLVSESVIEINTALGKTIILGRKSEDYSRTILGLNGFYRKLKSIWYAARAGNPFADCVLIRIEQEIQAAESQYRELIRSLEIQVAEQVQNRLNDETGGYHLEHHLSLEPISIRLQFKLIYGHRVARLIALFDRISTLLLSMSVEGLISRKRYFRDMRKVGKPLRRIYRYGQFWKTMKVTRDDVRNGTGIWLEASRYFRKTFDLELTREILEAELKPQWGPSV